MSPKLKTPPDNRHIERTGDNTIQILPESGALRQWQRQLRAGERTLYDIDLLWRAACAEANAREWAWYPPAANEYRRQAGSILRLQPETTAATTPAPFAKLLPTHYARMFK